MTLHEEREAVKNVPLSAVGCEAITSFPWTSDRPTREIFVGVGGSLILTFTDGSEAEHINLIQGGSYPYAVVGIDEGETGTSAASIVAHF